jgi:hypothetical protein
MIQTIFIRACTLIICLIQRYIDDIFFTLNQSLDAINQMLNEANNSHPNIKLVRQLGTTVSFLDVLLKNQNGVLATSVSRKEAAEPYIVPFKSDHPRHVFNNIIDGALLRAMRYSYQSSRPSLLLAIGTIQTQHKH